MAVKLSGLSSQTALLVSASAIGFSCTTTSTLELLLHPLRVTVSEYLLL
ncbi:MAG: hypothetical protein R2822_00405 [Spirosomataceae bacterium]